MVGGFEDCEIWNVLYFVLVAVNVRRLTRSQCSIAASPFRAISTTS